MQPLSQLEIESTLDSRSYVTLTNKDLNVFKYLEWVHEKLQVS